VKSGKWDRKTFVGVELYNKNPGHPLMGRIGTEIAPPAIAFGMRVLAYDPYLSRAAPLAPGGTRRDARPDSSRRPIHYLHMPAHGGTKVYARRRAIGEGEKRVCVSVNCARGGLIDEAALSRP